jgi:thiol-disulfide isomerase/thioredoxin
MLNNELNSIEQVESLVASKPAVMVYFYNDNCAPCISLRPKVINLLDKNFEKMELAFVNSGINPEVPARYQAFTNPTLIVFFDGREYRRESKYISIPQLAASIDRPYGMIFE